MVFRLQPREWVVVPTAERGWPAAGAGAWPLGREREEPVMAIPSDVAEGLTGDNEGPREKPPRKDKGRRLLTARDRTVLSWATEQYGVRVDQLQRLLGRDPQRPLEAEGALSLSGARHVVARWEEGGYAESAKIFFKEPAWVWPSRKGLQFLRLDHPYHRPAVSMLPHYFWVNETRLYLEGPGYPGAVRWRAERMLKPREARAGAVHYVDAEVELDDLDGPGTVTIAIEVELTPKKPADLRLILEDLLARYAEVWYFALEPAREGVERAIRALGGATDDRVQVYRLENLR